MTLNAAALAPWCKGPTGLCDTVQNNCLKCNSVNRDNAFRAVREERKKKFIFLKQLGEKN